MNLGDIEQEAFCSWLCQHEYRLFERPAGVFDSPLAEWLSELSGHLYGVDGGMYGRACWDYRFWHALPRWALVLMGRLEACPARWLTGSDVFVILAGVEMALVPRGSTWQVVYASCGACLGCLQ